MYWHQKTKMPVQKLQCLSYKVQVRGLPLLKIKEFTFVNACFQKWHNEEPLAHEYLKNYLKYRMSKLGFIDKH